jgi:hypothetical protein
MEWLATIARTGAIPPVTDYLVSGFTFKIVEPPECGDDMDVDRGVAGKTPLDKGKGKARDEDFDQQQSETLDESFAKFSKGET